MNGATKRKETIIALLERGRERQLEALEEQLADLRRENAKMLRHIQNVETERRQLREALTACQQKRGAK